ncbi:MFS transporter [Acetobacteraceae bacterium H6797]|nr:MFS transporter [Acetobacteraceae bacterium H6797]
MSTTVSTTAAPAPSSAPDGLPTPRRYWAALTVALTITMAVMDGSIANVALPTLSRELNASPSSTIWVANAYQLAVTVSLLPLAALAEIISYRRVYLIGIVIFAVASLACALSDSLAMLTAARVVQGFGGACLMSINAAVIRFIYPRAMLGKGIGINAVVVATASAVGPTVASAVLSVASWPWLFAVNVPIAILAWSIGIKTLPPSPRGAHRFDFLSAMLSAATFGLLISGIDGLTHGASPIRLVLEFGGMILAGVALVLRQAAIPVPLLPLDLLRIPIFTLSLCTSICSFMAQMMSMSALPFLLTTHYGFSVVQVGLLMTPWPLATAIMAPFSGRFADRYPSGLLGFIGMVAFGIGLGSLAFLPEQPSYFDIGWRMAIAGLGFGLFQTPNNRTIIGSAPRERSGGASGMLSTARLVGQTIGTAIVALLLARAGDEGSVIALYTAACISFLAACVSATRLLTRERRKFGAD